LLQFRRMRKAYTKGIGLANKHVLLAASAYNLKKLLAFTAPKNKNAAIATTNVVKDTIGKHLTDFFSVSKWILFRFFESKKIEATLNFNFFT